MRACPADFSNVDAAAYNNMPLASRGKQNFRMKQTCL
jgi:hypothetical protein